MSSRFPVLSENSDVLTPPGAFEHIFNTSNQQGRSGPGHTLTPPKNLISFVPREGPFFLGVTNGRVACVGEYKPANCRGFKVYIYNLCWTKKMRVAKSLSSCS
jgi:hypothetical protein